MTIYSGRASQIMQDVPAVYHAYTYHDVCRREVELENT